MPEKRVLTRRWTRPAWVSWSGWMRWAASASRSAVRGSLARVASARVSSRRAVASRCPPPPLAAAWPPRLLDEGRDRGDDGEDQQRRQDRGAAAAAASVAPDAGEQEVPGLAAQLDAVGDHHPVPQMRSTPPHERGGGSARTQPRRGRSGAWLAAGLQAGAGVGQGGGELAAFPQPLRPLPVLGPVGGGLLDRAGGRAAPWMRRRSPRPAAATRTGTPRARPRPRPGRRRGRWSAAGARRRRPARRPPRAGSSSRRTRHRVGRPCSSTVTSRNNSLTTCSRSRPVAAVASARAASAWRASAPCTPPSCS